MDTIEAVANAVAVIQYSVCIMFNVALIFAVQLQLILMQSATAKAAASQEASL